MLLINKENFVLQSDRRVVKADESATVTDAAGIIAAAEADAARIREEAKAAFEEEKRRGYEKGLAEGKMEMAMQKLNLVDSSVRFMEGVESKMAEVVMKALKSCVVEIGDKEMIYQIVRKTMRAVIRTQRHVTLKVAPEMVPVVKERVTALTTDYPTVETQLAAIERSIKRHIEKAEG